MSAEKQLLDIKHVLTEEAAKAGLFWKTPPNEDPVEAVRVLMKCYEREYQRNRDKAANNGAGILQARFDITKIKQQLKNARGVIILMKKRITKLKKLTNP